VKIYNKERHFHSVRVPQPAARLLINIWGLPNIFRLTVKAALWCQRKNNRILSSSNEKENPILRF